MTITVVNALKQVLIYPEKKKKKKKMGPQKEKAQQFL